VSHKKQRDHRSYGSGKFMQNSLYLQPRHEHWQHDSLSIAGEETDAEAESELKLNVLIF
jgi:hypothetical protein